MGADRRILLARTAAGLTLALLTCGCADFPALRVQAANGPATTTPAQPRQVAAAKATPAPSPPVNAAPEPLAPPPANAPASQEQIAALFPDAPLDAELTPQPLPQFIDTVFGQLLHVPYVLGPGVATNRQIVALRGAHGMSKRAFVRLVQNALKDYGVRLSIRDGSVLLAADEEAAQNAPVFLRARSTSETPEPARPVVQLFTARAVDAASLYPLLADVFPDAHSLALRMDTTANAIVLEGDPVQVADALEVLQRLDDPRFASATAVSLEPVYWSTEGFAGALRDGLTAQGYAVASAPGGAQGIGILDFPAFNRVIVFAKTEAVLGAVRRSAQTLDQPAAIAGDTGSFVYRVRNTDAQSLADLVGSRPDGLRTTAPPAPTGLAGTTPAAVAAANTEPTSPFRSPSTTEGRSAAGSPQTFESGRMIVDVRDNRIIFTGPAKEFAELRGLLASLDSTPRQVLVEVTVAEVNLTDETQVGLEWFFSKTLGSGTVSGGTLGGLGLSQSGLTLNYAGRNVTAAFDAFASNNKVNILSRPRLVTSSGGDASIQVGTDVPIITSQASSPTAVGGTTGILQTIQYRQTGVILHIHPIIYGDDLVNIVVTQEVSSQQANPNAAIASPLILNRNLATQLSVEDGATAVLGGLIDDNYTKGNTGIPILKDVPLLGSAFRSDTISGAKTELVILLTPYILRQPEQLTRWADAYSAEINAAFRVGQGGSYTLTPLPGRPMEANTAPTLPPK